MRLFITFVSFLLLCTALSASEKPNILFIFCDDLGYGDIGVFYQNERAKTGKPAFSTPHIDQLAHDGIQLRAHYAPAPVCAPSRASLFLGRHQGNVSIRDNQFDKALPNQPTLASTLKQAGYRTALIGKYGLQGKGSNSSNWPAYPTKRGFDYFLGGVRHRDGHEHYPYDKIHHKKQRTEIWEQDKEISSTLKGCYTTDLFTAASKKFIIEHKQNRPNQPFFLFLSYDTPHAATQLATSPYPDGFGVNGGLQWIGKSGKMINTANDTPDSYLHPDYAHKDWTMTPKRYASSIRRIDNSVADIRQTLVDLDIAENTLVIFTSDNGPSDESYLKENLVASYFRSYGPFTGIKRDCWEGGIRPGAIASWPGQIKPQSISQSPSQMHDWMATFCDIAGMPTPAISDGVSLLPTLNGENNAPKSTIYVEYNQPNRKTPNYLDFPESRRRGIRGQMQVIREGNLKAIRYNVQSADDPFMIFDLDADPGEINNLAGNPNIPNQAYWHATTARLHGKEPSAKRPYDNVIIPGIDPEKTSTGVIRRSIEGKTAYATRVPKTAKSEVVTHLSTNAITGNTEFTGYLKIDKEGKYQFSVPKKVNAVLHIHGILVIDTDSAEPTHSKRNLDLGVGKHPFTLNIRTSGKSVESALRWKTITHMSPVPTNLLLN